MEFEKFPKIPRLSNSFMRITEKIDGTNAQILITPDGRIQAGSRNRWIWPNTEDDKTKDNYGFASWVKENETLLRRLGPGRHFGEWWGHGIGRNYGMAGRKFSLFNVGRFAKSGLPEGLPDIGVGLVPVFYEGPVDMERTSFWREKLIAEGSVAMPGFMQPEGTVVEVGPFMYKDIIEKTGPSPEEKADGST
jgi:hypothetical protein